MANRQTARSKRPAATRLDVLVHAAPPVALCLLYLAPIPYEAFLYRPGRSGIAGAYLSALGHADLAHLLTNLFGYVALTAVSFALLAPRRKRLYYALFFSILLAVPPLAAGLIEFYLEPNPAASPGGAGFSIVTAALIALLAAAVAIHQRDALERSLPTLVVGAGLFSVAAFLPALRAGGLDARAAALGCVGGASIALGARSLLAQIRRAGPALPVALQVTGTLVFLGAAADLFLLESRAWAGHFLGFLAGAIVCACVVGAWRLRAALGDRRSDS